MEAAFNSPVKKAVSCSEFEIIKALSILSLPFLPVILYKASIISLYNESLLSVYIMSLHYRQTLYNTVKYLAVSRERPVFSGHQCFKLVYYQPELKHCGENSFAVKTRVS